MMVTFRFPVYFSNWYWIQLPITIGTTVTFFSFHNFPIYLQRTWLFSIYLIIIIIIVIINNFITAVIYYLYSAKYIRNDLMG